MKLVKKGCFLLGFLALFLTITMINYLPMALAEYNCCESPDIYNTEQLEIQPTCTEPGKSALICLNCHNIVGYSSMPDRWPALGHNWNEVNRKASCTSGGYSGWKCSRCGIEEGNATPALGHDWQYISGTAGSCTQPGTAVYQCSRCGQRKEENNSSAPGHDWRDVSSSATCTSGGYSGKKCNRCGAEEGTSIPALGHSFGKWETVSGGKQKRTCVRCGYTETKGCDHSWDNGVVVQAATATQEGQIKYTCKKCGTFKIEVTAKIKVCNVHSWGEWTIVVEATVTSEGRRERKCGKCGTSEFQTIPRISEPGGNGEIGVAGDEGLYLYVSVNATKNGFRTGDEVTVNWTIVNSTSSSCTLQGIYFNQLNGDTNTVSLNTRSSMSIDANGGRQSGTSTITINAIGFNGSILNFCFQARVNWHNGGVGNTNHVTIGIKISQSSWLDDDDFPPDTKSSDVSVVKSLLGQSADPQGFQIGEKVRYLVSVTNNSKFAISDVVISDPIADNQTASSAIGTDSQMSPGETANFVFERTVSAEDVDRGFIANTALASWRDPGNQETISATSNTVVVSVIDKSEQPKLEIEKRIANTTKKQSDGSYRFVSGDVIQYEIIIRNNTKESFKNVRVFDTLNGGTLGTIPSIVPGEERTLQFQYTVQPTDADVGKLTNLAAVIFEDQRGNSIGAYTEEVEAIVAQSDGKIVSIEPSVSTKGQNIGKIPTVTEQKQKPIVNVSNAQEMPVSLPNETEEFISCKRSLVMTGDGVKEYQIYRCAIHDTAYQVLQNELGRASNSIQKKQAWDKAAEQLKQDIIKIYDASYKSATSNTAKMIVEKEQQLFFKQMDSLAAFLQCLYPNNEELVSQAIAEQFILKCSELCYEVHCAPLSRADSYTATVTNTSVSSTAASCIHTNSNEKSICMICNDHITTENQIMQLVMCADSAERVAQAWRQGQDLWWNQYKKITDKFYQEYSDQEKRSIVKTERQNFKEWLMTRQQFLELLYTDNPETVAEVLTQEMQVRVMLICHYTENMSWR